MSYLECDLVGGRPSLLQTEDGAAEELLGMRLLVEHLVGPDGGEDALQTRSIWAVEKEFLPETLGQLCVFVVILWVA